MVKLATWSGQMDCLALGRARRPISSMITCLPLGGGTKIDIRHNPGRDRLLRHCISRAAILSQGGLSICLRELSICPTERKAGSVEIAKAACPPRISETASENRPSAVGPECWHPIRKAIRREFEHCPTQGSCKRVAPAKAPSRAAPIFSSASLVHDLRKSRQAAGLTLAAVSRCTGIDQATLSRLENGRQRNPTVDTLRRYADAIGRRRVLTIPMPGSAAMLRDRIMPNATAGRTSTVAL
jgi:Helix-turn-helix